MATEKRLIDANALSNAIPGISKDMKIPGAVELACLLMIAEAHTVDAVEVVHGRWISDEGDVLFHCSECDTQISTSWDYDDLQWNYCPSCGAKMDGDGDG